MSRLWIFLSSLFLLAVFIPRSSLAQVLPLEEYLGQVEQKDPGYRGSIEASTGAQETSAKAALLFRPQFYSQLQYIYDTRDTHSPPIYGSTQIQRNASVGLREQTPYGLGVQLSLDLNQSSLLNTNPALVTQPNLLNTYVNPQFNISLWQNFLGRADRANQRVMKAKDLATAYGKSYEARATLVKAEAAYWKLAVAREAARVQQESVQRAQAILQFDSGKAKRHLIDPSDLLVAQAAVKGKELELRSMSSEVRSAELAFNSARGLDTDSVPEDLELPPAESLEKLQVPTRAKLRGDVQAAQQGAMAEEEGSEMAREKMLPELTLYGSVFAYGLNFSLPLDFGTTSSVRAGYAQRASAADLNYQRKLMDQETEWKDLVSKFSDAKDRLEVALDLEKVQRAKFENVRKRRARGLTIEDQVFEYELDYLNASLARVQIEGMILGLRAQMKLYESSGGV